MSDLISRTAAIDALIREGRNVDSRYLESERIIHESDAVEAISMLSSAQPEIVQCKDCKHFHYDMPYVIQGIPVLGHEVCDFWGDGCKTSENGFCSFAERRTEQSQINTIENTNDKQSEEAIKEMVKDYITATYGSIDNL